jgi:hypothetical protein
LWIANNYNSRSPALPQKTPRPGARFAVNSSGEITDLSTAGDGEDADELNEDIMNIHDLSDTIGSGLDKDRRKAPPGRVHRTGVASSA